ncbi:MAG: hypothetical protein WBE34_15670, partial [Candidatus Nitrosopolaris sp.]
VAPIFLGVQRFPYNSIWFAGIYARGCIRKLFLVRVIMKVVRNIVEGVRFIIATMLCTVLVVVWHYECHHLIKGIRKG